MTANRADYFRAYAGGLDEAAEYVASVAPGHAVSLKLRAGELRRMVAARASAEKATPRAQPDAAERGFWELVFDTLAPRCPTRCAHERWSRWSRASLSTQGRRCKDCGFQELIETPLRSSPSPG